MDLCCGVRQGVRHSCCACARSGGGERRVRVRNAGRKRKHEKSGVPAMTCAGAAGVELIHSGLQRSRRAGRSNSGPGPRRFQLPAAFAPMVWRVSLIAPRFTSGLDPNAPPMKRNVRSVRAARRCRIDFRTTAKELERALRGARRKCLENKAECATDWRAPNLCAAVFCWRRASNSPCIA